MSKIDWISIRNEYINGNISYRKLCDKYSLSYSVFNERARKEEWHKARCEQRALIKRRLAEESADRIVDRGLRLLEISDKLASKLEKAVDELEFRETLDGKINVDMVNVKGISLLAKALKDIKDIQSASDDEDDSGKLTELLEGLKHE